MGEPTGCRKLLFSFCSNSWLNCCIKLKGRQSKFMVTETEKETMMINVPSAPKTGDKRTPLINKKIDKHWSQRTRK